MLIDNFLLFWVNNTPFQGQTIYSSPNSSLNDGTCDILELRAKQGGRVSLTNFLLKQENGKHINKEGECVIKGLKYFKTKLWRLFPKRSLKDEDVFYKTKKLPKYYSIDGERYPIEPIQVKVLPSKLRIFCLN